jgi:hypothetical protein
MRVDHIFHKFTGIDIKKQAQPNQIQNVENLKKTNIQDIVESKLPATDSMSHMLQTYRHSMHPFYHKGIDETLATNRKATPVNQRQPVENRTDD